MFNVSLAVIAKSPTYITWCEKQYPHFKLKWFKTVEDFLSDGDADLVLTDQTLETTVPRIDLTSINLYQQTAKLIGIIDIVVMQLTLADAFTLSPSLGATL